MIYFDCNAEAVEVGDEVWSKKDNMVWKIIGFAGQSILLRSLRFAGEEAFTQDNFKLEFMKVK